MTLHGRCQANQLTTPAEQLVTFELVREIAPLTNAPNVVTNAPSLETTPPICGKAERAGLGSCVTVHGRC